MWYIDTFYRKSFCYSCHPLLSRGITFPPFPLVHSLPHLFMLALCNRADDYIFILFLLSFFFLLFFLA